ncbi:hypothetical protein [Streptomyces sp. NBC_01707]|uniref:hypothetical protein n=1 Tax=Streptomyces sp. NBC_01707 TaxID=2975914 RepID=UPI002F915326
MRGGGPPASTARACLRELDADNPVLPLLRVLSTTGNLKGRGNATVRGLHLSVRATVSFDAALGRPGFVDAFDKAFGGLPEAPASSRAA